MVYIFSHNPGPQHKNYIKNMQKLLPNRQFLKIFKSLLLFLK
ncbi:hypothetical protein [Plasmodium yoelii yoelii]|uniref:Uncharacterized protein n=1 Tax=Plasmodium yoelii yoelii TaxID=73239 RepID=Q7R8I8_PLAYO|nr:hypothetical protein [Plasmodium yoelii yoelii]